MWILKQGDSGKRVEDMQWLLAGHNRYGIQTYRGEIDGDFGPGTAKAAKDMKYRIGYPEEAVKPTAGATLRSFLLPLNAEGAARRPPMYVVRARSRRPSFGYPLAKEGKLIGMPYQGTNDPKNGFANWESDRACDIAIPEGTPVLACFNGVIGPQFGPLASTNPRLLGLRLHLVGDADEAYYAHLKQFAPSLSPGDQVRTGDVLGLSGVANGVEHLHFALKVGWPPTFLAAGEV